ncbi:MAG: hypothetical protein ACO1TE_08790 [Prosthecobacter sp.]
MACLLATAAASGLAQAQEPAVFTPPQAYPVDRYEAAWGKNPFTLKTAPAVVENISFAKDLAIGSHYGDKANPTIVIVNTKTHQRTPLKQGATATNGMKLVSVKLGATRKDTTVEVVLGSETTELKYDMEYLSQMAAAGGGAGKPAPGTPINPNQRPGAVPGMPMQPGMQQRPMPNGAPKIQLPNAAPGGRPVGVSSNMQQQQRGGMGMPMVGGGGGNFNASVAPSTDGTNINLTLNPAGSPGQVNGPLVSDVNNPNAPPVPVRRRLISAPTNEQVLPQ